MRHGKLCLLASGLFVILLLAAGSAQATQRCVLAELFTSTACTACPKANAALDSVVKYDFGPDELAVIRNGLGYYYTPSGYGRFSWYNGQYTPTFWADGVDEIIGNQGSISACWTAYKNSISARSPINSPLELDLQVDFGAHGDTGFVTLQIVATDTIPFSGLRVRTCIVEDGLSYSGKNYNQMLRTYFCPTTPVHAGTPISISEGDTIIHTDDFIMDPAWVVENCRIVAFVQNNADVPPPEVPREVAQAIQKPVLSPVPSEVANLNVTLHENDLHLEWSPVELDTTGSSIEIDYYAIYRDTLGFFGPGSDPFTSTVDTFLTDSGVVGDTSVHYYYTVTAVAETKESCFSEIAGEFDKYLRNSE